MLCLFVNLLLLFYLRFCNGVIGGGGGVESYFSHNLCRVSSQLDFAALLYEGNTACMFIRDHLY